MLYLRPSWHDFGITIKFVWWPASSYKGGGTEAQSSYLFYLRAELEICDKFVNLVISVKWLFPLGIIHFKSTEYSKFISKG